MAVILSKIEKLVEDYKNLIAKQNKKKTRIEELRGILKDFGKELEKEGKTSVDVVREIRENL
jgi:chromosome segregation ATPase